MNLREPQSGKVAITQETVVYQCNCDQIKKIRAVYDGGFGEKFTVEYCEKCFDSDDKQFMLSMEVLQ